MLLNILATLLIGAPQLRVVVNIPAYRVDAYVGDSLVARPSVAVGMPTHPTPRGAYAITSIEWNPWWNPPKQPWAAGQHLTPPGPTNPMGRVKLNFEPLYYLHGTPLEASIGSAASHGCIRLKNDNAIALAELVERFSSRLDGDGIARAETSSDTRAIIVDPPVPIDVRYDLVEIMAGQVFVYRDIYGLAARPLASEVVAALGAFGIDTLRIDSAQVRALVQQVPANGRSVSIGNLLISPPIGSSAPE